MAALDRFYCSSLCERGSWRAVVIELIFFFQILLWSVFVNCGRLPVGLMEGIRVG